MSKAARGGARFQYLQSTLPPALRDALLDFPTQRQLPLNRLHHRADLCLDHRTGVLFAPAASVTADPLQNGFRGWPGAEASGIKIE